jgi:D-alanyl-D-alanine carboxypeptidase
MGSSLRKNGTRAVVVVTAVCAALSPAALAAVGGVSANQRELAQQTGGASSTQLRDAAGARAGVASPAVVKAVEGVMAAGAPGVTVSYRDAKKPGASWTLRRGVGDLASNAPVPAGASFRIGSVTKTFLATAVLQADEEGRLGLGDSLAHWLPGVLPKLDESAITVRMLLDHTSGVPDPTQSLLANPSGFGSGPVTPADLVAKTRGLPPVAAPGKEFSYSNADYWLLAMILEKATGETYQQRIEARVLRPLGLTHTVLPSNTTSLPSPFMHGYAPRPGKAPAEVTGFRSDWGSSSGGIVSTTADLDRFSGALLGGRLLSQTELAKMKRGTEAPENPMGVSVYGLGLTKLRLSCGVTLYGNMGGLAGYTTWMQATGDGSRQIAVAANTEELPRVDEAIGKVVDVAFCG